MMNEGETEEEFIGRLCNLLAEHFDAVQILATRLLPNGATEFYKNGSGNWMLRKAMAEEFLMEDAVRMVVQSRGVPNKDDESEGTD